MLLFWLACWPLLFAVLLASSPSSTGLDRTGLRRGGNGPAGILAAALFDRWLRRVVLVLEFRQLQCDSDGSLGAAIGLMMDGCRLMGLVLFGAELNWEIERQTAVGSARVALPGRPAHATA